jgi:hypothetical protein
VDLFDLSPAALFAGMVVSSVGLGLYVSGKRNQRLAQLVSGLLLMGIPLVVHGAIALWAVGGLVVAGLWLGSRLSA